MVYYYIFIQVDDGDFSVLQCIKSTWDSLCSQRKNRSLAIVGDQKLCI